MSRTNGYTPTQARIVKLLSDGEPHRREELRALLPDDLGGFENLKPHLTAIRKHLRPRGEDIVCRFLNRGLHYQHVRLISSDE